MINVVVTCTKKKRKGPAYPLCSGLQLGSIPGELNHRFQKWIENIDNIDAPSVYARDLYVGDHWSVACSLTHITRDIKLWVCSAGYGLITPESLIKPYSATFSMYNADSVGSIRDDNRTWWSKLGGYRGGEFIKPGQPRSLKEIALCDPNSPILVIASKNYLDAIKEDVLNAITTLKSPRNLAIISAGTRISREFTNQLVECDARFSHIVKGARRSLNVRIARELLSQPIVLSKLKAGEDLVTAMEYGIKKIAPYGLPDVIRYTDRVRQTDEQLQEFISSKLRTEPESTSSKLLRDLRIVHKKQCEQRRFSKLFHQVKNDKFSKQMPRQFSDQPISFYI